MTDPTRPVAVEHPRAVDLFHTAWVKAFIRVNHAQDLETVEILLSIGQQLMARVPRRRGQPRLDIVLATMLRPALLAAKAADVDLRHGLYEPAVGQMRTLLELDLNLQYMLADPATKNHRADRYLALASKERLSALREQLTKDEIRRDLPPEQVEWIEGRIRVGEEGLAALPEATEQNKTERNWHPYRTVKGLAEHLQRLGDYLQLYKPLSGMSVHAADPESHVVIEVDGRVHIKALATTAPHPVGTALNLLASLLIRFLERLRDEWGLEEAEIGQLLRAATMRFIGPGDGTIPPELRPDEWATAISVTQTPLGEILEEAAQLLVVVLRSAPHGLTEAEITATTGLEALGFGARGEALLRLLLQQLVDMGQLALETTADSRHYRAVAERPA